MAGRSLVARQPVFDDIMATAPTAGAGVKVWKESFIGDLYVRDEEGRGSQEAELSPIGSSVIIHKRKSDDVIIVEGESLRCLNDVPSLPLPDQPPAGYLKPHPFPRKRQQTAAVTTTQEVSNPPLSTATSSSFFDASSGRDPWSVMQQASAKADLYTWSRGNRENLHDLSSPPRKKQSLGRKTGKQSFILH